MRSSKTSLKSVKFIYIICKATFYNRPHSNRSIGSKDKGSCKNSRQQRNDLLCLAIVKISICEFNLFGLITSHNIVDTLSLMCLVRVNTNFLRRIQITLHPVYDWFPGVFRSHKREGESWNYREVSFRWVFHTCQERNHAYNIAVRRGHVSVYWIQGGMA